MSVVFKMPWKEKRNAYGDVIEIGRFLDNSLNGEGVAWRNGKWWKSPHFYNGSINGLCCSFDCEGAVDFYGVVKNNKKIHLLEYHVFLDEEYEQVSKFLPMLYE